MDLVIVIVWKYILVHKDIYIWPFLFLLKLKKYFPIQNIIMKDNVSVLFLLSYCPLTFHNLSKLTSSLIWYPRQNMYKKKTMAITAPGVRGIQNPNHIQREILTKLERVGFGISSLQNELISLLFWFLCTTRVRTIRTLRVRAHGTCINPLGMTWRHSKQESDLAPPRVRWNFLA